MVQLGTIHIWMNSHIFPKYCNFHKIRIDNGQLCRRSRVHFLLLQKRAVASAGYRSHSEPLFKFYNLLKVNDIYTQRLLVFYYNVINKIISSNFNNFIPEFSEANNFYPTRNPQKQIPKHSHEYIKFTCRYQVAILVNEIISNTGKYYNTIIAELFKNIEHVSLVSFKKSIRSYLLNDYSYICNLNNCYICQT